MTFSTVTPHLDEMPPGDGPSEIKRLCGLYGRGLLLQDVALKNCILILSGLFHVLLMMSDLVAVFAGPYLVAVGFDLSDQLFSSGSSIHFGHRKSGKVCVKMTGRRPPDQETVALMVRGREKWALEQEFSAGWSPYIECLRPCSTTSTY